MRYWKAKAGRKVDLHTWQSVRADIVHLKKL
jgi:hypothetical protein